MANAQKNKGTGPTWTKDNFTAAVWKAIDEFFATVGEAFTTAVRKTGQLINAIPREIIRRVGILATLAWVVNEFAAILEGLKDDLADAPWVALFAGLQSAPPLNVPHARQRALNGERFVNGIIFAILGSAREVVTFRPGNIITRMLDRANAHDTIKKVIRTFDAGPAILKAIAKVIVATILQVFRAAFTLGTLLLLIVFVVGVYNLPQFEKDFGGLFFGQNKPKVRLTGRYRTRKP